MKRRGGGSDGREERRSMSGAKISCWGRSRLGVDPRRAVMRCFRGVPDEDGEAREEEVGSRGRGVLRVLSTRASLNDQEEGVRVGVREEAQ